MTTDTERENRKLIPFKLPPDLIRRLKDRALADGEAATALVESGIERELAARAGRKYEPPTSSASRTTPDGRPGSTASGGSVVIDPCARCGHARSAHWGRGCLAGCACGERLYRPRT